MRLLTTTIYKSHRINKAMNQIRNIERLNQRELEAGMSIEASWHSEYNDTAYIYFGSLPYELTEGDILIIFSQYGIPVHLKLVRDKETGKSKGFGWLKYEDQRSTILAVDNLNGTKVLGRVIRVDHARYEEREFDEEYEGLLEDELRNDFADEEELKKEEPINEKKDDEFEDPLLLMKAQEKSEDNEHRSKSSKDGEDRHRSHRSDRSRRSHGSDRHRSDKDNDRDGDRKRTHGSRRDDYKGSSHHRDEDRRRREHRFRDDQLLERKSGEDRRDRKRERSRSRSRDHSSRSHRDS